MKKRIMLLCALALLSISLVACKGNADDKKNEENVVNDDVIETVEVVEEDEVAEEVEEVSKYYAGTNIPDYMCYVSDEDNIIDTEENKAEDGTVYVYKYSQEEISKEDYMNYLTVVLPGEGWTSYNEGEIDEESLTLTYYFTKGSGIRSSPGLGVDT